MPRRSRSVAQQAFGLQVLTVLLVVAVAVSLAYVDARRDQRQAAATRSVDIAEAVADAPVVRRALADPEPARTIQPYAEQVRRDTGTDFVVVMALDRTRYSHPDPEQIGRHFIGDLGTAPQGRPFTQEYTGTLGPSVRAVVPVREPEAGPGTNAAGGTAGKVVALVSVGITVEKIDRQLRRRLWPIGLAAVVVLGLGATGSWLISRRLRRATHGLGAEEITRMYEYYDSVLHAVREGLILLDVEGRVQLANDEAVRLLGTTPGRGARIDGLGLPEPLAEALRAGAAGPDDLHLVGDRVLVVNQAEARWEGQRVGSVVTLRDHTELQAVSGELDTVRGLAESLRAQNHESANRLHTVVSLIELGRVEDAVGFATAELEAAQGLTDRLVAAVEEPVVAAVLLGKTAQATERGVDLGIDTDTEVTALPVEASDLVTLLGNLVDNALDAVAECEVRRVDVRVVADGSRLLIEVGDSGPGVPEGDADRVFRHGWSTKSGPGSTGGDRDPGRGPGRGLGLALVGQVVRRYGGTVTVGRSHLGGALFTVAVGEGAGSQ